MRSRIMIAKRLMRIAKELTAGEVFDPKQEFKFIKRIGDWEFYDVEDSGEGMVKVRRALDAAYGTDTNPWCLAARTYGNDPSFELGSDNFETSFGYWRMYRGEKRIAFNGDKPVAFYAGGKWCDIGDHEFDDLYDLM